MMNIAYNEETGECVAIIKREYKTKEELLEQYPDEIQEKDEEDER